ncbi:MAG: bacteriocin fulvocin C-related protein [Bacteroidia bacterium]|nr:bacteriocin fulvocin C-related protein [Bacteroidia bacterium]
MAYKNRFQIMTEAAQDWLKYQENVKKVRQIAQNYVEQNEDVLANMSFGTLFRLPLVIRELAIHTLLTASQKRRLWREKIEDALAKSHWKEPERLHIAKLREGIHQDISDEQEDREKAQQLFLEEWIYQAEHKLNWASHKILYFVILSLGENQYPHEILSDMLDEQGAIKEIYQPYL